MSGSDAPDGPAGLHVSDEVAEQAKRLALLVLREPFKRRSWAELGFFLASSALAGGAVVVLGVFGLTGLVLAVIFVGLLVLASGLRVARGLGRWQRVLALRILGEAVIAPEPFQPRRGALGWLRAALGDRSAWQSMAYFVAKVPLTLFGIWFALNVWLEAILGIASPFTGGHGVGKFGFLGRLIDPGSGGAPFSQASRLGVFVLGLAALFIAPWTMRLVVYADRRLMHFLLGPDATVSWVRSLEESRAKTLDAAAVQLRRIERDLHDGTQAQLVALAMRLGQAKEKLEHVDYGQAEDAELDAIRRLVEEAHRGAKDAITDLRDLARGIHPPALDTGLENALATLAARSPVPTVVTVSVHERPSPAVEAIAYFCAAELLANVAQHAEASRTSLSCTQHGPWMRIVVRDDGMGGASVNRVGSSSSGLAGLADRVGAVDGHLGIASPPGGPTVVTVDLPART